MRNRDSEDAHSLADLFTGSFLFLATAAFVFWQNTHLTVLWDLSYILENATRISLGQLPYRDFPFPYAPLTFVVQAAIIKLFGRVVLHHYLYAAVTAGLGSLLTWRILLRLLAASRLPARTTAFLLALPLIFLGTGSIFPHPFYDSDCTVFMLFCIWLLLRLESSEFPVLPTFACGLLLTVPVFIKQNTGLAFLLSAAVCIAWFGLRNPRVAALLFAGASATLVFALGLIQWTCGLSNYIHWTLQFAASRRLPGFAAMLSVYRDPALLWSYTTFALGLALLFFHRQFFRRRLHDAIRWLAAALLSAPFLHAAAALLLHDNASERVEALLRLWPVLLIASLVVTLWRLIRTATIAKLVPLIVIGTVQGAFLSQQLWGSTYALWPLLMILIASILAALARKPNLDAATATSTEPSTASLAAIAAVASIALTITGAYYALSHERLDYVDLSGDVLERSSLPALRGLAMRGSWLPDFEELVRYSDREIPKDDAILMIPGEDLFYFTTGRAPQFPVLMMDNTVNPYSSAQLVELTRHRNIRWIVVKRKLQLQEEPLSFQKQLMESLTHDFEPAETLNNYDIYSLKQK